VRIQFKDVTRGIFKDVARNELVLRIQPSEAVYLKLNTKAPGLYTRALPTEMDLTYKRRFVDSKIPEAYEALILDAIKGDHSNFVRHDELDVAWKVSGFLLLPPTLPPLSLFPTNKRGVSLTLDCSRGGFFFGPKKLDLHAHLALDRREERSTPQASTVPLWFTGPKGDGRLHREVRLQAGGGIIVSVFPSPRQPPFVLLTNAAPVHSSWPMTELANL
jgi:hypothetical protein